MFIRTVILKHSMRVFMYRLLLDNARRVIRSDGIGLHNERVKQVSSLPLWPGLEGLGLGPGRLPTRKVTRKIAWQLAYLDMGVFERGSNPGMRICRPAFPLWAVAAPRRCGVCICTDVYECTCVWILCGWVSVFLSYYCFFLCVVCLYHSGSLPFTQIF